MQSNSFAIHTAQQQNNEAEQTSSISQWTVSTYRLTSQGARALVHIDHPNGMGIDESNGLPAEKDRFMRFRSRYISQDLHDAAIGQTTGVVARFFRRSADPDFLERCRQKTCYRKDEFSISSPISAGINVDIDSVSNAVERACSVLTHATNTYGPDVIADMELGFSKPFPMQQLRDSKESLPLVSDAVLSDQNAFPVQEQVLSVVVSYRHTTPKLGHILNIDPTEWQQIADAAAKLCEAAGRQAVRFWTDHSKTDSCRG